MSVVYTVADQVLRVDDRSEPVEARTHRFDAFLNLLCAGKYSFQRDAVRDVWRFLVSDKYPDTERLIRENWKTRPEIAHRFEGGLEDYLDRVPLRWKKAVTLDLATGTGKSYALYALAAMALAEGLADRVLVLCPSLTIEDALWTKFERLIGTHELSAIMKELGAVVPVPGLKRGNETIGVGDICIENIHAVYENAGSSIADSFRGHGGRTLVLNDEAHHLFSPDDTEKHAVKKWLQFLLNDDYGFRHIVNSTGTAFIGNEYFRDVVHRYGLKRAIEDGIVKKPDYVEEETKRAHGWERTLQIHERNRVAYGAHLKPISIVVTADIAGCVEAWKELVDTLVQKQRIARPEAERRCIWVASGIPSNKAARARVERIIAEPEKVRKANLVALATVDEPGSPVEWIVSVSMLTEGWDVKNVFQIVPHESRAFESKLLIAQVLGRGLRVPPGLSNQPLVMVNNHAAWSDDIRSLLADVLEIENRLSWGYHSTRQGFVFPLHNLRYEMEQKTEETKRVRAREPDIRFRPQQRKTREKSVLSESGTLMTEVEHQDNYEIGQAVKLLKVFFNDNDPELARKWPNRKIRDMIEKQLCEAGQPEDFLSRENLLLLQQAFGPMFRNPDAPHPRVGSVAKDVEYVDLSKVRVSSISESTLREHGTVFYTAETADTLAGAERDLWGQYQQHVEAVKVAPGSVSEHATALAARLKPVDLKRFKAPLNMLVVSHEPERKFAEHLLAESDLFDAFVKMPDLGGYSFPYSFKPSGRGRTHVSHERFNPDFFLKVKGKPEVIVVEIKQDGDDNNRNRAKLRDGLRHFDMLNRRLEESGESVRYRFKFLTPEDYPGFFGAVRDGSYPKWKSELMIALSAG